MIVPLLLAAAVATTPRLETDLPPPPLIFDPPEAPIARPVPTPPVLEVPGIEADSRTLLGPVPEVLGGYGGIDVLVTPVLGAATQLSSVTLDLELGGFTGGFGLVTGATDAIALTYAGPRAGLTFASLGPADFSAAMMLGVGRVTGLTAAAPSTTLVALQPEVAARIRILPWLRAHASLGYRMLNAGEWTGPSGDAMSGVALGIGLDFGAFDGAPQK